MTATHVMGMRVIKTFPVPSGVQDRSGADLFYHQVVGLQLSNGHKTYGCLHCDYTNDNVRSIRPHLRKHGTAGDGKTPRAQRLAAIRQSTQDATGALPKLTIKDLAAMSLEDLLALANKANKIITEGDAAEWKRRALEAEGKLETLRSVFGRDIG